MTSHEGKAYIVTGAARGIGRGVAARLCAEGAGVLMVDLEAGALEAAHAAISRAPGFVDANLSVLAQNVAAPEAGEAMVAAALDAFGRLDGIVTCAGIIALGPIMELTPATWDRTMATNLKATFFNVQAVARHLLEAGQGGGVVTISSTSAHGPRPGNADYGISKIGVDHMTRSYALELAPADIRVNAISPGPIDTPMFDQVSVARAVPLGGGETARQAMLEALPLGRFGKPEDIAAGVAWLLSDQACFVTGQVIEFDGGWTLANA